MRLRPVQVDQFMQEDRARVSRVRVGTDFPPSKLLLPISGANAFSRKILDDYNTAKLKNPFDLSVLTFSDITTFGKGGILLTDLAGERYLCGVEIGWSGGEDISWMAPQINARFDEELCEISVPLGDDNLVAVNDPGVLVVGPGTGVYGHWLLDFVPRLEIAYANALLANARLALPRMTEWTSSWVYPFLQCYGIDRSDIFWMEPDKAYCWKRLIVPSYCHSKGAFGETCQRAWKRVRDFHGAGLDMPLASQRIFVSRRELGYNKTGRWINNYRELLGLFDSFGVTTVFPEKLKLSEQAAVFSSADLIIGEDGSGLHNCVFRNTGGKMVVLLPPGRNMGAHPGLANLYNMELGVVSGERRDESESFDVDLNSLTAILDKYDNR